MEIKFILCPRADCNGLVFQDITNSSETGAYDFGINVPTLTGLVRVFKLPICDGDTPVAIYSVQPTILPNAKFDLLFEDPDVDDLPDGFYQAVYEVYDGNTKIGSATIKFAFTCRVECKLQAAQFKAVNGGCDNSLLELVEASELLDGAYVAFNKDEYATAWQALSGVSSTLKNCNCV